MNIYQMSDAEMAVFFDNPIFKTMFILLIIWSLTWKGIALWKAARNSKKYWFIAMLVINTVGILEILYVFFFSKKKEKVDNRISSN